VFLIHLQNDIQHEGDADAQEKGKKYRRQCVEDGEKLLAVKKAENYGDSDEKDQNHAPENFTGKTGIGQKLRQFQKNHLLSRSGNSFCLLCYPIPSHLSTKNLLPKGHLRILLWKKSPFAGKSRKTTTKNA